MTKIIVEAECPACGEIMKFENVGKKPCKCGEMMGELTVSIEWEENPEHIEEQK